MPSLYEVCFYMGGCFFCLVFDIFKLAMIKKQILKNNIALITEDIENAKSVALGFYFLNAGSRYENDDERGISHFCEHMLFKGASYKDKNLTPHDIALVFDRMGGYVNAFTERDDVCAYCIFPALENNLNEALKTFCAMASCCTFPPDELENERAVIKNEVLSVLDDSEESALEKLAECMWHDNPLGKSITGSVKDVESLTREALLKWYEERFVKGELAVSVSGALKEKDYDLLAECLEKLPEHSKIKNYPGEMHVKEKALWHSGTTFSLARKFSQVQVYVLYPVKMPMTFNEMASLTVLNTVVGDAMSSRLFESLREKNGLCYNTYSFSTCYEDAGFWGAVASCDKENVVKVSKLLLKELNELLSVPPSDEEIKNAKAHVLGEEYLAGEDSEAVMKRNFRNFAMGLELPDTEKIQDSIRNVQKNAIIELIKKLISEEKRIFFVYGPKVSLRQKKEILCKV